MAPAGPVIPARSSRRLVNIGVGEMHARNAIREINLTHAGVVQLQCIFQLIVPAELMPNGALEPRPTKEAVGSQRACSPSLAGLRGRN